MPELPEVETITRDLEGAILGAKINDVIVYDDRVIKDIPAKTFQRRLKGQVVQQVSRRAKAIVIAFESGQYLVVQLKMTGQMIASAKQVTNNDTRDVKVVFRLSNQTFLHYNDQRTFGWLILTDDLDQISYLKTVGMEPFDKAFNARWLRERFKNKKAPIKSVLLDQRYVAGLGNIYVCEILYLAGISPLRSAGELLENELKLICQITKKILKKAIRCRGTSMRNYRDASGQEGTFNQYLKVYGREGKKCFRCSKVVSRMVQAGRGTFYCQNCQT